MEVEVDVGKQDGEPLTQAERKEPAWSTRAFEPAHGEIDAMVAKIIRDNLTPATPWRRRRPPARPAEEPP